jgi:hypothetical protein
MNREGRTQLALGLLLILLGVWFLADRSLPAFHQLVGRYSEWPLNLVAIGTGLLLLGLFIGAPGMAVPAAIVAGLGGIFYYQETTGDYASWSYMWTLIPGFMGVGSILAGLLGENTRRSVRRGLDLLVVSAVLFLVFSSAFGGLKILGDYGAAILLILLGLWVLGNGLFRAFRRNQ